MRPSSLAIESLSLLTVPRRSKPENIAVAREPARVLSEIVGLHLRDLDYSISDLAKMLHVYPGELNALYAVKAEKPGRHLKAV